MHLLLLKIFAIYTRELLSVSYGFDKCFARDSGILPPSETLVLKSEKITNGIGMFVKLKKHQHLGHSVRSHGIGILGRLCYKFSNCIQR